ncbi:hypothetical protein L3X38_031998 [Prunus dulcis]|uniref:Uncharacterized protein n=1 Tax=Prunus dulcis TaxID=3755 RepID=A0AAD4YVI0_PRUDU|nr:hypothetical protein L3X38_031998 [Prunus dulcis]
MNVGMENPRYEYCGYECGDEGKKINGNGDGNDIPTLDSTHCHPYTCSPPASSSHGLSPVSHRRRFPLLDIHCRRLPSPGIWHYSPLFTFNSFTKIVHHYKKETLMVSLKCPV